MVDNYFQFQMRSVGGGCWKLFGNLVLRQLILIEVWLSENLNHTKFAENNHNEASKEG
jgi:hypothetical protein